MAFNAEKYCGEALHKWQDAYFSRDFARCTTICEAYLSELKDRYLANEFKGEEATWVYVFLILIKGLNDMSDLAEATMDPGWIENDKKVEAIWCKLWITRDRFDFFQAHCLEPNILKRFTSRLDGLESFFYDEFGAGLYFSPEIRIKKSKCSVCDKNIKACEHLIGNVYEGKHCQEVVVDAEFQTISIVKSPHDMRCRIWPWNVERDEMTVKGMFMCLETIDDFLKPQKQHVNEK